MKLDITVRHIDKKTYKFIKKQINHLVEQHLKPHLAHFNDSLFRLHATVEHGKNDYKVQYHLHLPPRKILVAKKVSENLVNALEESVKELARQAQKHTAKISGRENWKRKARIKRINQFETKVASELTSDTQLVAKQQIEPLLPKIERYILQELTYLQSGGDLPSNYPTVEDVQDEALLKAQIKWDELDKTDDALYQELIKAVHEVLAEEVMQSQLHANDISLDAEVPQDAEDQAEEMVGEDIFEFYQPFERLHIEDIIPDATADIPEELLEKNAQEVSYQSMANLPTDWRRMLILVHRENMPIESIAQSIMPMALSDAKQLLDSAEQFMLASLNERGLGKISQALLKQLLK